LSKTAITVVVNRTSLDAGGQKTQGATGSHICIYWRLHNIVTV
jgi:hypothetical protein